VVSLLMLVEAYTAFQETRYLNYAQQAADVVWRRGLLRKGNGLCHGVSGNAYCFLSLYRATQNERYLNRVGSTAP
jgi:lantibiotic modifying enzyme